MIHISIEGMDGVGKSTTCKLLAEKLGYIFVEKPLHYLFVYPTFITPVSDILSFILPSAPRYDNIFSTNILENFNNFS